MSLPDQNRISPTLAQQERLPASTGNFLVSQAVTLATAGALLLGGWLIFVRFAVAPTLGFFPDQTSTSPKPATTKSVVNTAKPVLNTPKTIPTAPQAAPVNTSDLSEAYARQEQLVLLRLQRLEFEPRITNLKTDIDLVEKQFQKWDRRIQSLLRNDEGKRLVSSASQFRFLLSLVPLTKMDLQQLQGTVTDIHQRFAQATTPLTNLDSYGKKLAAAESRLYAAEVTFDALEPALDELLAASKPVSVGRTLAEAIDGLDTEAAERVSQTALEKKQELQTSFAQEIATLRQLLETRRTKLSTAQSDTKKFESEIEKQLADATNKRNEQLRELAQQRLAARKRMEEELPAFRDRLSPFISKGYRQPESRYKFVIVIEAQPISYSSLIRIGALNDDVNGLGTLMRTGDSDSTLLWNDRPFGSFPKYGNWEFDAQKPEIIRQLKAVQEFLRRHGDALVEAKLLNP